MAKTKQSNTRAPNGDRVVATNRRARFDYELFETWEAGLVLNGSEARALRDATADITEAYVALQNGEAWVKGMRIPVLQHAFLGHLEKRDRKLLLHRAEIEELERVLERERMTLVLTKLYFKEGRAKVELAAARGKQLFDKRQALKERDADKEARAAMAKARSSGRFAG